MPAGSLWSSVRIPPRPRCRAAAPLKYPSAARTFGLSFEIMTTLALQRQVGLCVADYPPTPIESR